MRVPAISKLDSDDRRNTGLCGLALRLAGKSTRIAGLGEYTRAVAYAEDTSTGTIRRADGSSTTWAT